MREAELRGALVRHFEALGHQTALEFEVARRRADIVVLAGDSVVAVELKVSRWRQALRQAVAYQVWAPWAYVALPYSRGFQAMRHRHRFEAHGVGLLAVRDEEVRTFLPARPSPRLFPALAEHTLRRLADGTAERPERDRRTFL